VGLWGLEGMLPALSTKKGRGACRSFEMELGRGTSFSYSLEPASKPTNKLVSSHSGAHKTHHGLNSGEATTFPHIIFFALLRGTHIRMIFYPGTPKEESRNCLGLDSWDFASS